MWYKTHSPANSVDFQAVGCLHRKLLELYVNTTLGTASCDGGKRWFAGRHTGRWFAGRHTGRDVHLEWSELRQFICIFILWLQASFSSPTVVRLSIKTDVMHMQTPPPHTSRCFALRNTSCGLLGFIFCNRTRIWGGKCYMFCPLFWTLCVVWWSW